MRKKRFEKLISYALLACLVTTLGLNPSPSVAQESTNDDSSAFWLTLASNAWRYFQPGIGVEPVTGLPENGVGSHYFTDWDAGFYVQAVIDAEKLGLIERTGTWGFDDRIDKVLSFLEKRPLMADGLPYLAYNSETSQNANTIPQVATDAGCLFVALKNLETTDPSLKPRIDNIVYNLTNYEKRQISVDILLGEMLSGKRAPNIYDYYVTMGFAGFWPQRFAAEADSILNIIVSSPKVNYHGIELPKAKISSDPLLLSIFNLNPTDPRVLSLSEQAYLAQELRYNSTGKFTAFSEGFSSYGFIWEWVILPDGRMWVVQTGDQNDVDTDLDWLTPIVYYKAATGFLAIYNTNYTQTMVNYLLKQIPATSHGYAAGVDEKNNRVSSCDFGNGLIVSAARYAVENKVDVGFSYPNVPPSPSPSQSPITLSPNLPAPTPQNHKVPTQPEPMNASEAAPTPPVDPPPSASPRANQNDLSGDLNLATGFYVLSVSAFVCIMFVAYWFGKKRFSDSDTGLG